MGLRCLDRAVSHVEDTCLWVFTQNKQEQYQGKLCASVLLQMLKPQ